MTYRITVILIPQGGHLSPLLFLLYINIIKQLLKYSNILAFADDLKIFLHINSIEDCIRLQTDLNNIFSGCNSLGLKMNIYKCQSMIFTRCCSPNHYRYNINHFELSLVTDHIRDIFILWCQLQCGHTVVTAAPRYWPHESRVRACATFEHRSKQYFFHLFCQTNRNVIFLYIKSTQRIQCLFF